MHLYLTDAAKGRPGTVRSVSCGPCRTVGSVAGMVAGRSARDPGTCRGVDPLLATRRATGPPGESDDPGGDGSATNCSQACARRARGRKVSKLVTALCKKCEAEPALPGQRWGRACFAEYRRQERARGSVERGDVQQVICGPRVLVANPAQRAALLVGPARLLDFTGPVILEATTPGDAAGLRDLAGRHPAWIRVLSETGEVRRGG